MWRRIGFIRPISTKTGPLRSEKWLEEMSRLLQALQKQLSNRAQKPSLLLEDKETMERFVMEQAEQAKKIVSLLKEKFENQVKKSNDTEELKMLKLALKELEETAQRTESCDLKTVFELVRKQTENLKRKPMVEFNQKMENDFRILWNSFMEKVKGEEYCPKRTRDIYLTHSNIEHALSEAKRALPLPDTDNRTDIMNHQKTKIIKFLAQLETKIVAQLKKTGGVQGIRQVEESIVETIASINSSKEKVHMMDPEQMVRRMVDGYDRLKGVIVAAVKEGLKAQAKLQSPYQEIEKWLSETKIEIMKVRSELELNFIQSIVGDKPDPTLEDFIQNRLLKLLKKNILTTENKIEMNPLFRKALEEIRTASNEAYQKINNNKSLNEIKTTLDWYAKQLQSLKLKVKQDFGMLKYDMEELIDMFSKQKDSNMK